MTPTLRVVLIVVSILTTFMIMRRSGSQNSRSRIRFSGWDLVHSHCVQYLSGAAGSFGGAGGNVHDCQILSIWRLFSF